MKSSHLKSIELKKIARICERVHYSHSKESFANHLYVVLKEALPSIHFMSIHFLLSPLVLKKAINQSLPDKSYKGFIRYMHQHPGLQRYCASNQQVGSLLTELNPSAYRKTDLYNEVYRPVDIEDQVWIGIGDKTEVIALSYSRDTAYTELDLTMLSLIKPHANIAWKNWKRIRTLEARLHNLETQWTQSEQDALQISALQSSIQTLTPRQRQVVEWVAAGKTNLEISAGLKISPRTVGKHLENIFTALQINNRTALTAYESGRTRI
jgi:DNA-binding CsgD family transcriptional regulator